VDDHALNLPVHLGACMPPNSNHPVPTHKRLPGGRRFETQIISGLPSSKISELHVLADFSIDQFQLLAYPCQPFKFVCTHFGLLNRISSIHEEHKDFVGTSFRTAMHSSRFRIAGFIRHGPCQ